ncbi:hypothetical protein [Pseudooceanicola algae]|uniref:Uncharacterized protein n=1 Tax=Pseudooceanicola algae TaxID=1537215 RepID=A0A418SGY2_9RHOB|nr:hypothetical protein [Pseudooceanicola algae]QPM88824.1 hypothetical protein PSAL_000260 [Pseudooceanicola algae]
MKAELNLDTAARNAAAVEAVHWEPPMAPLDMPRQTLEREAQAGGFVARLFGALRLA